nr:MAG TPA: Integrase [Caudoviricetes sp.]
MAIETYQTAKGQTRYRAVYYSGSERKSKRGFKTKKDAKKWLAVTELEGDAKSQTQTFRQAANDWLLSYEPTVVASTYNKTRTIIKHAIEFFGDALLENITVADAQALANAWSYDYVNHNKMIQYTSCVFDFATNNGYISENPFKKIRPPKNNKKSDIEEKPVWTKDEMLAFLDCCKKDERKVIYPFFRLLAYTGLRRQEIVALLWSDYDGNTITVEQAITFNKQNQPVIGDTKTPTSRRTIALDDGTIQALNEWRKYCDGPRMFDIGINRPYRWLCQITEKHNLPPGTIRNFRHFHCSILVDARANIKDIQKRLGHANVQTTLNVYAHANRDIVQISETFADYLENQKAHS